MRHKVVYIAGRYTGETQEDRDMNIEVAKIAAKILWNIGYAVYTPHLNTARFEDDDNCICDYEGFITGHMEILSRCDAIYMLDGWKDSSGALQEHEYAVEFGIPVFFSIDELRRWGV